MIRSSVFTRPLSALALVLVAAPLAAQERVTVTGQPVFQERVSFADLDLRQLQGRQTLNARVYRVADRLCAQAEGPFLENSVGFGSSPGCAELTYRNAKPQIAAAVQRAKAGQQLTAMTVVVSAPRAAR
jgi:UrcA family protein